MSIANLPVAPWGPGVVYGAGVQVSQAGQVYARLTAGTSASTWAGDSANWLLLGTLPSSVVSVSSGTPSAGQIPQFTGAGSATTPVAMPSGSANALITLPASNGTGDASVINAAITAANAAGHGLVKAKPGQIYVIDATVIYRSNVTVDWTGASYTRAAGFTGQLLCNAAAIPVVATATASMTAGSNVLSDSSAPFTAAMATNNQAVRVVGAGINTAPYNIPSDLAVAIIGYTSATQVTVGIVNTLTGATTALNAVTTVSNTGLHIFPVRDQNIGWIASANSVFNVGAGATTNSMYAFASGETGITSFPVDHFFRRVDNMTWSLGGAQFTGTGGAAGHIVLFPGDCTNFFADDLAFAGSVGGGFQIAGPQAGGGLSRIRGATHDDLVALQGTGYGFAYTNDVQGNFIDFYVRDITPAFLTAVTALKFIGGQTNAAQPINFTGITAENIRGTVGGTSAIDFINLTATGQGIMDQIVLRDVYVNVPNLATGAGSAVILLQASGIKSLRVENAGYASPNGSSGSPLALIQVYSGGGPESLVVDGVYMPAGVSYVDVLQLRGSTTQRATVRNVRLDESSGGLVGVNVVNMVGGATVSYLNLSDISGTTSGAVVAEASGAITLLEADAVSVLIPGGGPAYNFAGTISTAILSDSGLTTSGAGVPAITSSSAGVSVLMLDNVNLNCTPAVTYSGSSTLRLLATDSVRYRGVSTASVLSRTGSGTISANGYVPVDVSTLTGMLNGDVAVNTNAGLSIGAGRCVYVTAVTSWLAVGGAVGPAGVNGTNGTNGTSPIAPTIVVPLTLSGALSTGSPITSVPINAAGYPASAGNTFSIQDGAGHSQTVTVSGGGMATGATALPVNSFTPSFAFPSGSIAAPTSLTVTAPATAGHLDLEVVANAGGGGGGGASALTGGTATQVGGSGGGSGASARTVAAVTPGQTFTLTQGLLGPGGAGGAASSGVTGNAGTGGTSGSNVTVTGTGIALSAPGGKGGTAGGANSATGAQGGAYGGNQTGLAATSTGQPGSGGVSTSTVGSVGGPPIGLSPRGGGAGSAANATNGGLGGSGIQVAAGGSGTSSGTTSANTTISGQGGDGGGGGSLGGAGGNGSNGGSSMAIFNWLS